MSNHPPLVFPNPRDGETAEEYHARTAAVVTDQYRIILDASLEKAREGAVASYDTAKREVLHEILDVFIARNPEQAQAVIKSYIDAPQLSDMELGRAIQRAFKDWVNEERVEKAMSRLQELLDDVEDALVSVEKLEDARDVLQTAINGLEEGLPYFPDFADEIANEIKAAHVIASE